MLISEFLAQIKKLSQALKVPVAYLYIFTLTGTKVKFPKKKKKNSLKTE